MRPTTQRADRPSVWSAPLESEDVQILVGVRLGAWLLRKRRLIYALHRLTFELQAHWGHCTDLFLRLASPFHILHLCNDEQTIHTVWTAHGVNDYGLLWTYTYTENSDLMRYVVIIFRLSRSLLTSIPAWNCRLMPHHVYKESLFETSLTGV